MSVKVSGDTIQVGFSDLPLSVSVTVDVWRKGNERNVSSHVVTARPSYLSITALQEGATYCLRAQAQLETSTRNKSNNTDTQCVSIHSAPASSPLPITIGIIITVIIIAMAIIMGWSVAHYAYVVKEACSQKDLLPRALLFNWPITGVKLTAEEALEPTHPVVLVHIPDAESPHSKEETQPINSEERRASEREFGV